MNNVITNENIKNESTKEVTLETIISGAIQIPGVRVDRAKFLSAILVKETDNIQEVIDKDPIAAGIDEATLRNIANKLILSRTAESSVKSFAMGIPGGLAMAITIPADTLQFYGMTLKLAQELTYLYGASDLWKDGKVDEEQVRNQLILYCGVMFGISGAAAGVRVLSTQMAKTALKRIPQKALTKTFWYPVIKGIGKTVGVKVTKKTFANGVSKSIPVIGGLVSGTITFVSMKPMADKLLNTLEKASFHYTDEDLDKDIIIIENIDNEETNAEKPIKKSFLEKSKDNIGKLFHKKENSKSTNLEQLKTLKELLDIGAINQDEYEQKKKQILNL